MNEDLKALFEGQDFTQEFKDKVTAIFDSVIEEKAQEIEEQTEEKYKQLSEEYSEYVVSEMEDKTQEYIESEVVPMVEKYLDYSVQEFMTENKLAIESGTKVQLAEQFLNGLSGVAESFNVQVPEGREDYIHEMEDKLNAAQERFDKALDENQKLKEELQTKEMNAIVESKVVDLTESQKERFERTVARVKFQDVEQYQAAVDELYESYFPKESQESMNEGMEFLEEKQQEEETPKSSSISSSWEEQLFSKL